MPPVPGGRGVVAGVGGKPKEKGAGFRCAGPDEGNPWLGVANGAVVPELDFKLMPVWVEDPREAD